MALLYKMLRKRSFFTLVTVCATGLTAAVTIWWNAQLAGIIDTVGTGKPPSKEAVVWALVTMLAMGVTAYVKTYLAGYTCEGMTHDLRMGYARHFASLPAAEVENLSTGEQLSKLQNEISGVSVYLNANLFQMLDNGVRFISTFAWLLFLNPALTLETNLPVFAIVVYVVWSSKVIGSATESSQQAKGYINQYADTLLTLFPIIRLYDGLRLMLDGYTGAVGTWESQTVRAERTKARLMSLSGIMSNIPLVLLFLLGGRMAINSELTIGTLYIFLNLSGNVSGVMMNMPGYITALRQFLANMKRLSPSISIVGKGE